MSVFDWFSDIELDGTAVLITGVISFVFAIFFFGDPLNVGMKDISLVGRIIGWLLGTVIGYVIAAKKLEG
jgi:Mg2+/citrate symporter